MSVDEPSKESSVPSSDHSNSAPHTLQKFAHSASVASAMGCDVAMNYPLWVAAKRIGAGLPTFPASAASETGFRAASSVVRQVYRGGGALWLSLAPTTVIEDLVTHSLRESGNNFHPLACTAVSGTAAAVLVTSQVEHVITAAHTHSKSIPATISLLYRKMGLSGLALPPGMAMTVCREIPFASALFFAQPKLRAWVHQNFNEIEEVDPDEVDEIHVLSQGTHSTSNNHPAPQITLRSFGIDAACGIASASVACPISHIPSVLAAYQQSHHCTIQRAFADVLALGGWRELFRGFAARTISLASTMTIVPLAIRQFDHLLGVHAHGHNHK